MQSTHNPPAFRARRSKASDSLDARVSAVETEMKFVRRDLDEVRIDVRDIRQRVGTVEVTLAAMSERMDTMSTNMSERMDSMWTNMATRLDTMSEKMDRFPTKLQLSLWACAGLTAMLGFTVSVIAVLLRLSGHENAAAVVDSVSGN